MFLGACVAFFFLASFTLDAALVGDDSDRPGDDNLLSEMLMRMSPLSTVTPLPLFMVLSQTLCSFDPMQVLLLYVGG